MSPSPCLQTKKVAIVQSNYIPWKGYFDLIKSVDEFILYDDMQYTKRDWRNRNKIKTPNGLKWLSIPVKVKGKYFQKISDTQISNPAWNQEHWKAIERNYARTAYFSEYRDLFAELYLNSKETYLSKINYRFIKAICEILDIKTKISWSMDYELEGNKTEKLVNLCKQAGGGDYYSGPAAQSYIEKDLFEQESINLNFIDYGNYQEYNQLFPPFEHGVSVLDLIFNEGANSRFYLKSF